eukprot:259087_1
MQHSKIYQKQKRLQLVTNIIQNALKDPHNSKHQYSNILSSDDTENTFFLDLLENAGFVFSDDGDSLIFNPDPAKLQNLKYVKNKIESLHALINDNVEWNEALVGLKKDETQSNQDQSTKQNLKHNIIIHIISIRILLKNKNYHPIILLQIHILKHRDPTN